MHHACNIVIQYYFTSSLHFIFQDHFHVHQFINVHHLVRFVHVNIYWGKVIQASTTRVISIRVEINIKFRVRIDLILLFTQFQVSNFLRRAFNL